MLVGGRLRVELNQIIAVRLLDAVQNNMAR